MRDADVMPEELADAKRRVIGGMVMNMQPISQQAAPTLSPGTISSPSSQSRSLPTTGAGN